MIYMDNAATTKVPQSIINHIAFAMQEYWENPSSTYEEGLKVRRMIEQVRADVAKSINAEPEEILFTSCGSESNNTAIKGVHTNTVITTKIEHPSVYNTCKVKDGVYYLPVNEYGIVDSNSLHGLITDSLVSVIMANNEIGTIQPIKEISEIVHEHNGILHTDAVQAYMHIPIDVKDMGIDLMSMSCHKLGLPRGLGILYKKKNIALEPLIHGGSQEFGLRAGTENTALIYALGERLRELDPIVIKKEESCIRDYLLNQIYNQCKDICMITLNGHPTNRLPNNLSLTFEGIDASCLMVMLNLKGIQTSKGSACSSGEKKPSRILKSIGLSDQECESTLRISISTDTAIEECDKFVRELRKCLCILKNSNMQGGE